MNLVNILSNRQEEYSNDMHLPTYHHVKFDVANTDLLQIIVYTCFNIICSYFNMFLPYRNHQYMTLYNISMEWL